MSNSEDNIMSNTDNKQATTTDSITAAVKAALVKLLTDANEGAVVSKDEPDNETWGPHNTNVKTLLETLAWVSANNMAARGADLRGGPSATS